MRCPVPGRSRRQFLQGSLAVAGLGFLGGCGTQPPRPPRSVKIGVLAGHGLDPSPEGTAFRAVLRDLGYIERRNLTLIVRTAGLPETLTRAAAELVGQGVDVPVTVDDEATRAARDATDAVPIVMADSSDPVRTGLIASLGRPGGNVTGLTSLTAALGPKRLELLRAAVPGVARVAFLWAAHAGGHPDLRDVQAAAQRMGVRLVPVEAEEGMNMAVPLAGLNDPVDGVMVFIFASLRVEAVRVVTSLQVTRLPAIYDEGSFAHAGGLMAYGANTPDLFRRAAAYVDKILKGTHPVDLPVEQPTKFDFIVNLRTAQALGLTISPSVLQQATEVIQ